MKELVSIKELNGNAVVSSRDVANNFNKEHKHVIESIRNLMVENSAVKEYFEESEYKNERGRKYPEYIMNKDGFSLLAMGFTGSEALEWKLKYIEAFNYMVNLLREKQTAEWKTARAIGKQTRRDETDVIMEKLIPLAEKQGSKNAHMLYMVYSKLVNRVLGIKAGQRDDLPIDYIENIRFLERMIENIISDEVDKKTHYKEIFQKCKVNCELIAKLSYLPKLEELTA